MSEKKPSMLTKEEQIVLEGLKLLQQPFPADAISKLPKPTAKQTNEVKSDYTKGIRCQLCGGWHHKDVVHLDYVGHAALTKRLLEVDPMWNWEPVSRDDKGFPLLDNDKGMWINLTVLGVTRLGYGDAGTKTGPNATKERIGDALRNAAMRFGAAIDLWHKSDKELSTLENGEEPPPPPKPMLVNEMEKEIKKFQATLEGCKTLEQLEKMVGSYRPIVERFDEKRKTKANDIRTKNIERLTPKGNTTTNEPPVKEETESVEMSPDETYQKICSAMEECTTLEYLDNVVASWNPMFEKFDSNYKKETLNSHKENVARINKLNGEQ